MSRQRSRCGSVHIFGHGGDFSWQGRGAPRVLVVYSRLFVTGEGSERFYFDVLDVLAGAALWTWWQSSTCSDSVTGAMNRDFWRSTL